MHLERKIRQKKPLGTSDENRKNNGRHKHHMTLIMSHNKVKMNESQRFTQKIQIKTNQSEKLHSEEKPQEENT